MNHKKFQRTALLASLFAAAALTACGGGGDSGSTSTTTPVAVTPSPSPAPAATNPDLVTSVTAPTYAAGTVERGAWNYLMAQRAQCGFGLVQQDTRIDQAAAAHASYLVQKSVATLQSWMGHYETAGDVGFTGNGPLDRMIAAGYPSSSAQEILQGYYQSFLAGGAAPLALNEAAGLSSMRSLIETVYHASGAFSAGRFGGVGSASAIRAASSSSSTWNAQEFRLNADFAEDNPQKLGTGNLASYPCQGATVGGHFAPAWESPNPFPDVTTTATIYGTPIYFKVDASSVLVVSSATITKVSDGSLVATRQLTKANDPAGDIGQNEVFFVPTSALAPGASYTVNASGTIDGTAFTRAFTFSVAAS